MVFYLDYTFLFFFLMKMLCMYSDFCLSLQVAFVIIGLGVFEVNVFHVIECRKTELK